MKTIFTLLLLFIIASSSLAGGIILEQANVRETSLDVSSEQIVAEIPMEFDEPGKVVVRFDGVANTSEGDRIILAASNTGVFGINNGHVSVQATDANNNRNSFSHTMVYDVGEGSYTFYASVMQSVVQNAGSGIVSVYGSLTAKYIPSSSPVILHNREIAETLIDVSETVAFAEVTLNASESGRVKVRFDGTAISSHGDEILLAANDRIDWEVNNGHVAAHATSESVTRSSFSHTRVFDVDPGEHTFYATGTQSIVFNDGDGIATIYGALTVEFIPNSYAHQIIYHEDINLTHADVSEALLIASQIDMDAIADGKLLANFDGFAVISPGDRIILAASDRPDWDTNEGNISLRVAAGTLNTHSFSHSRLYNIQGGDNSFYAVAERFIGEANGSGLVSIYGRLTLTYIPEIIEECVEPDQSQNNPVGGIMLSHNIPRWQEFIPTLNKLRRVDLYIDPAGSAGGLELQITNINNEVLGTASISEEHLVYGWNEFHLAEEVILIPGNAYRINLTTTIAVTGPSDRHFWYGSNTGDYPDGLADPNDQMPNFSYSFRTFGCMIDVPNFIPQTKESTITIYPNPASENIVVSNITKPSTVSIYSIAGELIHSGFADSISVTLNVSSYPDGIYILTIQNNNTIVNKKFLIKNR
ncbi:T9SS type A sorting domain-containing protein [Natronoflexus pectinivorans]|uniref:Putative secreted protein (Por secretion system target) n=1 Tax=Natronoflexus pectinivorans TaxID=682526 RepID=A0A4R2GNW2_9BACT|nr:T9SS type A sorting domain-containing protein [Natronoflexus pectinivorans]TCO10389.1 putative secreted protein (Por secretion system target) [Natronoflexus pectinivorans]